MRRIMSDLKAIVQNSGDQVPDIACEGFIHEAL